MVKCRKCGKEKSTNEFYKRVSMCKSCFSEYNKEQKKFYKNNKEYQEKVLNGEKRRKKEKREWVYQFLLLNPCVDCGEGDPIVLEFDHVEGGKIGNVSKLIHNNCSLEKIKIEIGKCKVRCANCHRRKTAKDFNYHSISRA